VSAALDDVDRQILDLLRRNARQSAAEVAKHVSLTGSAVRRRISALEQSGVIAGYTVAIDHDKLDASVEAYVELTLDGAADVHEFLHDAIKRPEVREAMTIAGDLDALLRVRVRTTPELRKLVMDLRRSGPVRGSKTRIVIGRWWHGAQQEDPQD
jgi:Lrp/AsnC family transcriptional regulator, leucine-responsive regulatory protein